MMTLLRKHRNWLMIVIAILALPFCLYFVKTDPSAVREVKFGRLYGRDVTMVDAQRGARLCMLARQLGMFDLVRSLAGNAQTEEELYTQFALNRLVLVHEAESLGIHATTAELTDFVSGLQAFRTSAGFDPKKYDEFTQTTLPAMGFSEAQLEELAGNAICLRKIKDLVATGVTVPESQLKEEYQQLYGMLNLSVVRLRVSDFAKDVKVSDDDISKYFETHKAELKTEPKRKVEFVSLALTPEQKKLTGKERIDALQKLADRANDFTQALLEKGADFHQVAAKFQLGVDATGEFTATAPDPKLKADPQLTSSAFQLTQQDANSDALQAPDGFYVLHLAGTADARSLTVEEAKPKIVDAMKGNRAREMVATKGSQLSHDIHESLLSGAPLSFAAEKSGVKTEKIEPFSLSEDIDPDEMPKGPKNRPQDFMLIRSAASNLQPNDVSPFMTSEDGGVIVIMEKRQLPDETKLAAKKAKFEERILTNKRELVFAEWLRQRDAEAGLVENTKPQAQG